MKSLKCNVQVSVENENEQCINFPVHFVNITKRIHHTKAFVIQK